MTSRFGTDVRQRPILMSDPMVRAILDGRKTQTRRVLAKQPPSECGIHYMLGNESWLDYNKRTPLRHTWEAWGGPLFANRPAGHLCGSFDVRCPYGAPGDRLWVRETWISGYDFVNAELDAWDADGNAKPEKVWYRADDKLQEWQVEGSDFTTDRIPWKSPIHMRRADSRLTLEITEVRVQRVQEITEGEAIAEGIQKRGLYWLAVNETPAPTARDAFSLLWDSLNAKRGYSWESNPWVWALTFRLSTSDQSPQPDRDGS